MQINHPFYDKWYDLPYKSFLLVTETPFYLFHSFHWHVQNAMIPCRSQELFPFLSVIYFFQPPFSTNYSSILAHFILPSISWSTSQSCSQIHILGILFSSILCTYPNQCNLFNLIVFYLFDVLKTVEIQDLMSLLGYCHFPCLCIFH